MPAGRPSKYTPAIIKAARDYLEGGYLEYNQIPSTVGLSLALDVSRSTVNEWGDDPEKKEFSDILEKINATQHELLIGKGLSGDFNASIAKLALGKHGYSDKSENTHQGPGGGALTLSFVGVTNEPR